MAEPITLPVGATAEPDTCGSCRFFKRGWNTYESAGKCYIKLPPWVQYKPVPRDEADPFWVRDTDRCDLQQHTGERYIVQREVLPSGMLKTVLP